MRIAYMNKAIIIAPKYEPKKWPINPDQVAMALGINQMLQSMSYFIAGPVQKHRRLMG